MKLTSEYLFKIILAHFLFDTAFKCCTAHLNGNQVSKYKTNRVI